ncbi:glutamine amidotransferase [Trichoderma cornu-damae]|uniref:Pyridoxal 5'-phosphate synthase glutaminase subunit n=1 Tax=Trichoderma cornu-damae TaxID=654480 RepID=A0A9P8QSL7_9HYPO|nr:glutamine amidotransferase [Trichoderma cornu-damae]
MALTVGVLALQGGFVEHINLLRKAAATVFAQRSRADAAFEAIEVRTAQELARCDALIIPGGESTTISFVAQQSGLMEPLRDFVQVQKKPVWGTCAGLILLSNQANATKKGGQELIGGLSVRVHRNHFGRQIESFEAPLQLPFLAGEADPSPFPGVFIRAPVVEEILSRGDGPEVQVLAKLPGRVDKMKTGVSLAVTRDDSGDIIAVRQGSILGTSFHPELTDDARIHAWWLKQVLRPLQDA